MKTLMIALTVLISVPAFARNEMFCADSVQDDGAPGPYAVAVTKVNQKMHSEAIRGEGLVVAPDPTRPGVLIACTMLEISR